MKKDAIPQDEESSLSKKDMREVCYVVNEKGKYTTGLSSGWKAKTIALDVTIEQIEERVEQAKASVLAGKKSPIVYFMELCKMDWSILASYMEKPKWKIKRHAKPRVFKKLNAVMLNKYAEVFEVDVEQIKNFNENS
ncbi:MAG: hypothetical protein WEA99_11835 [Brumimicrobium sp.]